MIMDYDPPLLQETIESRQSRQTQVIAKTLLFTPTFINMHISIVFRSNISSNTLS